MDHRPLLGTTGEPTIGGVVSCNVSGPRRVQAGACRDSLIGVRFVDGAGRAIRNGGRVMKNVTGYDLVKLMAGSHGTLGVVSEVAFKVLPAPEATATIRIEGLSDAGAVAAMTAALTSPYDVTGAAHLPRGADGAPLTLIRIEGFEASVAYRAERLKDLLAGRGETGVDAGPMPEHCDDPWAVVRDARPFADRDGAVWRVSLKPSDAPALVAALPEAEAFFDQGGGLVWLLLEQGEDAGAEAVRGALAPLGGHATLVRAAPAIRAAVAPFHPEPAPLAAVSAGLRARFDPRGLLNPGRMAP
jgi:glycolate oxidase FAD binding subunit